MTRLADAIMSGDLAAGRSPMSNLLRGSQNGWGPNLAEYANTTSHVSKQLFALLMEAPTGFQYLPDPAFWVAGLKTLIESAPKTWEGFARGLEVEVAETPVSGGGEMHSDPTNVTRARTNPSSGYTDKYGRPYQTFFEEYILMLIGDPDTKIPGIATLGTARPGDLLQDVYSFTTLFVEPDPTGQFVHKAWLSTNMFPKNTGDITARRDLTAAGELSEFTVEWTATSVSNLGVRLFAQQIWDQISFVNANPNLQPAFIDGIDPNVAAAPGGLMGQVNEMAATAIVRS